MIMSGAAWQRRVRAVDKAVVGLLGTELCLGRCRVGNPVTAHFTKSNYVATGMFYTLDK